MMEIKAVVFDFGEVISFPPPEETKRALERLTGLPYTILFEYGRKYRGEWDRGTYDGPGYYRFILAQSGISLDDAALAQIVQVDIDGWKHMNMATVQLMRDIKAAGFTLGVLSNMPHDILAWARDGIPVFKEADVAVFSCEHHIIKPEPGLYEKLRDRLSLPYKEIVFFDDNADNITMAQKLGMQGYLWKGPEAARKLSMELGLLAL